MINLLIVANLIRGLLLLNQRKIIQNAHKNNIERPLGYVEQNSDQKQLLINEVKTTFKGGVSISKEKKDPPGNRDIVRYERSLKGPQLDFSPIGTKVDSKESDFTKDFAEIKEKIRKSGVTVDNTETTNNKGRAAPDIVGNRLNSNNEKGGR